MVQKVVDTMSARDVDTRSLARADVRVLRSLAGRVRVLSELARGKSLVDGEEPGIPKNPQGLYGVDLSGPPWGPAPRHAIWWVGGMIADTAGAGEWGGQRTHLSFTDGAARILRVDLWVRAHESFRRAPYSRGYPVVSVQETGATAARTMTVTCLQHRDDAQGRSETVNLANSAAEQSFELTDAFWDLVPGRNRFLGLRFETTHTNNVDLLRASINVTAKLGY